MSAIFYKNLPYGAGGSNVEANPSGSATGDLTKVGIDGTVYDVTDADAVHSSDKGVANGVASLDATGRVPSTQLPSYVDDVLEYASQSAFPATGESGKIYIALDTNKTYRWSGSAYVEISESLALGETTGTAYEGSKGKANADNIASLQTDMSKAYKTDDSAETDLQDTDYIPFYDTSATAKKKSLWSNIKAKLKAYFDTLYDKTPTLATVATSGSYNDLTNKPTIPSGQVQSDWNQTNTSAVDYIKNKPTIPSGGVTGVKGDSESSYRTGNVNITKSNIGLGNVGNFKAVSTVASQGLSDTEKSNARANIGAATVSDAQTAGRDAALTYVTANAVPKATADADGNVISSTYSKTDEKVKQENTTTNAEYRILFSNGANDTTETKTARKNTNLKYNPSTKILTADSINAAIKAGGKIRIYNGTGTYYVELISDTTANRQFILPNSGSTEILATREYLNSKLYPSSVKVKGTYAGRSYLSNGKLVVEFIFPLIFGKTPSAASLSNYATGIGAYGVTSYVALDNNITSVTYPYISETSVVVRLFTSLTNNIGDMKPAYITVGGNTTTLTLTYS